jgi:hypothetical protein
MCIVVVGVAAFQRSDFTFPAMALNFTGSAFAVGIVASAGFVTCSSVHLIYHRNNNTYRNGGLVALLMYGTLVMFFILVLSLIPEKPG